jgi:hypothetical protein
MGENSEKSVDLFVPKGYIIKSKACSALWIGFDKPIYIIPESWRGPGGLKLQGPG